MELTMAILENYNGGLYDRFKPIRVKGIPAVDGKTVINMQGDFNWEIDLDRALYNLQKLKVHVNLGKFAQIRGNSLLFAKAGLEKLGLYFYPLLSYGILNGGSATSYADTKKNRGLNSALFDTLKPLFDKTREVSQGRAKGLAPAYVNADGSAGPSFIELKMRGLLIKSLKYRLITGNNQRNCLFPLFQMTSVSNNQGIAKSYALYRNSPILKELIRETGQDITQTLTGVQGMLAAFTHSREGRPKKIFKGAHGREGELLALPGGHGQNFTVLKEIYRQLYRQGKRFVYLGNVDNLANLPDPAALSMLALSGKQAGFDFSFKTPVDIKGGILITDQQGRLNCVDIGPAVSQQEVEAAERSGKKILFNCATGLFNLEYLTDNIDRITNELPMRFSDQDKDAGSYSQAEQVTWEIIGMLDDFLIFGVNKYHRFLAAKLLMETLMTSGVIDHYPTPELAAIGNSLHQGLVKQLSTTYGMKKQGTRWLPKSVEELKREWLKNSV